MKFIKSLLEAKYTAADHEIFGDSVFKPKVAVAPQPAPTARPTATPQPAPIPQAEPEPVPQEAPPAEVPRLARSISEIPEDIARGFYTMRDKFARVTEVGMEHIGCWYRIPGARENNTGETMERLFENPSNQDVPGWSETINRIFDYRVPLRVVYVENRVGGMTRLFVNDPNGDMIFQWDAATNTDALPPPPAPEPHNEALTFKGFLLTT